MTDHVWKPWRPQVQDKEDAEDVDATEKEEDDEGRNEKQQCGNVSFPAEETKGKHRRNWYCFISTPHMLNMWPSCQRTSKLPHCIHNEKAGKKKKIGTHLYTIHTKHVTDMLEVIQLPHSICGKRLYGKDKQQYRSCTAKTKKLGHLNPPWPFMPKHATTTPRMYKWHARLRKTPMMDH